MYTPDDVKCRVHRAHSLKTRYHCNTQTQYGMKYFAQLVTQIYQVSSVPLVIVWLAVPDLWRHIVWSSNIGLGVTFCTVE